MNPLEVAGFAYLALLYRSKLAEPSMESLKTLAHLIDAELDIRLVMFDRSAKRSDMDANVKVLFADGSVGTLEDLYLRKGQRITVQRSTVANHWQLVQLRERTDGTQNMALRLATKEGLPAFGVQTAYTYPSLGGPDGKLPPTPPTMDRWSERACIDKGRTNAAGYAEYTVGSGSWLDGAGVGPYSHFIVDPERGSDVVSGIGWYPGSNHHGVLDSDWMEAGADDGDDGDDDGDANTDDLVTVLGQIARAAERGAAALERLADHLGA